MLFSGSSLFSFTFQRESQSGRDFGQWKGRHSGPCLLLRSPCWKLGGSESLGTFPTQTLQHWKMHSLYQSWNLTAKSCWCRAVFKINAVYVHRQFLIIQITSIFDTNRIKIKPFSQSKVEVRKLKLNCLPSAASEHTLPPPFRGTAEIRCSMFKGNNEVWKHKAICSFFSKVK